MKNANSVKRAIEGLKLHEHICVFYNTRKKWLATIIPFMRTGLEKGEKCLYIADAQSTKEFRKSLNREACDLRSSKRSGQFIFLNTSEAEGKEDSFDRMGLIDLLTSEAEKAHSEGYPAIRAVVEPGRGEKNGLDLAELSDFVSRLSRHFFPKYPCLAVFLYDRRTLPPGFVTSIMVTHMLEIRGTHTYLNLLPMLEDELSKGHFVFRPIELWLDVFKRGKKTKKSIQFLSEIIDHSSQPMVFSYTDGHLLANRALLDLLGIEQSEVSLVRGGEEYLPIEWVPAEIEAMKQLHRMLKPVRYEKELLRKNGERIALEILVELKEDENGKPVYVGWATDITARKAHEKALRESEERYRRLAEILKGEREDLEEAVQQRTREIQEAARQWQTTFDSIRDPIMVLDTQFRILRINRGAASFLGLAEERIVGSRCFDLVHQTEECIPDCPVRKVIASKAHEEAEIYEPRRGVWLQVSADPVLDASGNLVGAVHALSDITRRKQTEEDIATLREELRRASRITAMGELTGALAHELNQPLTGILSNAQAIQRFLSHPNLDLAEIRECLSYIVEDTERARGVVSGLRSLFKREVIEFEMLDMNDVIRQVHPLIRSHALLNNVFLVDAYDPGILPVSGNRIQLQQVLLNLVSNAIEAMKDSDLKTLGIQTRMEGGEYVVVKVEDSGIGVEDQKKGDIFKPFITTKKEGMGMGLAISHSIIKTHKGRIWMEKNAGPGTTFYFTLPVVRTPLQ